MGASLSSKINNIEDLQKKLEKANKLLSLSLSDVFYQLEDAGVTCAEEKECQRKEKLIAAQHSSILTGFNKGLLEKQKRSPLPGKIPYKIVAEYENGENNEQIEDSIKHAKDYLTLKLRLYQLMDHILKNKQFCIAYTRDIANTSVKIYNKTLHEKINKKELSPKTIDNLSAVANKIISLIKLNIGYINTLQSIVKKMNDTLTLEELETLEQKTYKLLENDEIKCCQLADMLQLLALECNDQGCTNIFTSEAASVPEFDKIELKTPNKEFCSSFNKNYFTQLGKYFGQ